MRHQPNRRILEFYAFSTGTVIGILGGLIGLGGAEFRLPVLVGLFRYRLLVAIVVNLLVSLVTVIASLIFRVGFEHCDRIQANWPVAVNILAGSLLGSYLGVNFATRVPERVLNKFVAALLFLLSAILIGHDVLFAGGVLEVSEGWRLAIGLMAGLGIGTVCSLLGVAGGELIIPTLVLIFALEIKQAGSVSLAISIPTIIVGLSRYSRKPVFAEALQNWRAIIFMAAGSIAGAWIGSALLHRVSGSALQIFLGMILLVSATKMSLNSKQKKISPDASNDDLQSRT